MNDIYLVDDDRTVGPFRAEDVREMVRNGAMKADVLAWAEGMEDWRPLREAFPDAVPGERASQSGRREESEDRPEFFNEVLGSFLYPVRGDGLILLIIGTVLLVISDIVMWAPVVGWIASLFVTFYYAAYLFNVIQSTAVGESDLPHFPGTDDMIRPLVYFVLAFVGYLAPAVGYWLFTGGLEGRHDPVVWALLFFAGLLCVPMALLRAAVLSNALDMFNVFAVVGSIARIFLPYLLVAALLGAISYLSVRYEPTSEVLPLYVSYPLATFVFFYFSVLQARLIGVLYLTRHRELGWLE